MTGQGAVYLYRLFNESGELLYIGVSQNVGFRLYMHSRNKSWYEDVASHRLVGPFLSRKDAEAEERRAIQAELPRHNVVHTDRLRPLLVAAHRARRDHLTLLKIERERAARQLPA